MQLVDWVALVQVGVRVGSGGHGLFCRFGGKSAVVVLCCLRNPCCVGDRGRVFSSGSRRRSNIFTAGHRRDMGRYPDPESARLPGFRIGTVMACFQMAGMSELL